MTGPAYTYQCHNGGFRLTSPWPIHLEEGTLTIPEGFITDGASVPRLLWIIPGFDHTELGLSGPCLHDAIYQGTVGRNLGINRRRADDLLRILCQHDGVGRIRARIVWSAVRAFGWLAWRRMPNRERALWMAA